MIYNGNNGIATKPWSLNGCVPCYLVLQKVNWSRCETYTKNSMSLTKVNLLNQATSTQVSRVYYSSSYVCYIAKGLFICTCITYNCIHFLYLSIHPSTFLCLFLSLISHWFRRGNIWISRPYWTTVKT